MNCINNFLVESISEKLKSNISFMTRNFNISLHRNALSFNREKSILLKKVNSTNLITFFKVKSVDVAGLLLIKNLIASVNSPDQTPKDLYYFVDDALNMSSVPIFSFKTLQDCINEEFNLNVSYDDAIGLCNGWDGSVGSGESPSWVKIGQLLSEEFVGKFNHRLDVKCH
jgi:hypothetical protein